MAAYTEYAQEYAGKIYSMIPDREKRMLKDQLPRAKKMSHKLINMLQQQLARAKYMNTAENPSRLSQLRVSSLSNALQLAEKVVESIKNLEQVDAFPVLEPVPHHQYQVIPDEVKVASPNDPVKRAGKRKPQKKAAAAPVAKAPLKASAKSSGAKSSKGSKTSRRMAS